MFLAADKVVKAVIIGLALASVITWTIGLAKAIELATLKRKLRGSLTTLDSAGSSVEAAKALAAHSPAMDLVRAAMAEETLSAGGSSEGMKERVASRLERIEAAVGRRMARGTGILATIGATAPFIGLFGTVWGIMDSFLGISKAQTTNLAVVAPGIAEALLATAIGLIAAIPAVVIYNMFARGIPRHAGRRSAMPPLSVLRLVSRDIDRSMALPRNSAQRSSAVAVQLDHGADDLAEVHEINVTPFIDVMLVLLIIFMVAAPLATVDVKVDLPVSTAEPQPRPDKPLFLTIKEDHSLALGDDVVAAEGIGPALDAASGNDKDQRIFLRADKQVDYGMLMEIMNKLRGAGYLKVALVGLDASESR